MSGVKGEVLYVRKRAEVICQQRMYAELNVGYVQELGANKGMSRHMLSEKLCKSSLD